MAGKDVSAAHINHFNNLSDPQERSEEVYFVLFQLDRQDYALPLENITCALRMAAVTPLLDAPPYIRGMINLHGESVPVEDLRQRFGGPAQNFNLDDRLLVMKVGQKSVALMVDGVDQVLAVSLRQMKDPPVQSSRSHFLKAVFYRDDRPVMVLHADTLLPEA